MYGLVNKAVRDLVISQAGEPAWQDLAEACGIEQDFIRVETYPDDVTYRLVAAAAQALDTSADEILRAFGRHWITYTAKEGYGPLVDMVGPTLEDFLFALGDDLHARVAMTMPDLQPPLFEVAGLGDGLYQIDYRSHRAGLAAMVTGLLEGLAERYARAATVTHVETTSEQPCHAVFRMQLH